MSKPKKTHLFIARVLECLPELSEGDTDFWLDTENKEQLRTALQATLARPSVPPCAETTPQEPDRLREIMDSTIRLMKYGTVYDRMTPEQISRPRSVKGLVAPSSRNSAAESVDMNRIYGFHEPGCMCGHCR